MSNMKNIAITVAVSLVVFLVGVTFIKPVQKVVNQTVGSVTGPDMFFPCESHNGLTKCFNRTPFAQATTTVCSFKTPAATSTLNFAGMTIDGATTTATVLTIAKGANSNASTTLLAAGSLAANARGTLIASSTASGASIDNANVFAPNTFINFSIKGGVGTFSQVGSCGAEFYY